MLIRLTLTLTTTTTTVMLIHDCNCNCNCGCCCDSLWPEDPTLLMIWFDLINEIVNEMDWFFETQWMKWITCDFLWPAWQLDTGTIPENEWLMTCSWVSVAVQHRQWDNKLTALMTMMMITVCYCIVCYVMVLYCIARSYFNYHSFHHHHHHSTPPPFMFLFVCSFFATRSKQNSKNMKWPESAANTAVVFLIFVPCRVGRGVKCVCD